MNFDEFHKTVEQKTPPQNISDELKALWYDAKENWEKAHQIVQNINTKNAAWVHAYLHRKEGNLDNASYWYMRADKEVSGSPLNEEWKNICLVLLEN